MQQPWGYPLPTCILQVGRGYPSENTSRIVLFSEVFLSLWVNSANLSGLPLL
jgi:hypothetical protein